jgi:hypothetical protein
VSALNVLQQIRVLVRQPGPDIGRCCVMALRVAPWLVFGPITGALSERALRCYRNGDRVLAVLYVVLNVSILVAIPALTAALAVKVR